jgi:hypothetical protein
MHPKLRRELAIIWHTQAATEMRVARSFELVHEALVLFGADDELVALAARGIDDEVRHAELCQTMCETYAGASTNEPLLLEHYMPRHPLAESPLERAALIVVGQCALNETFASAYLSAAYESCESPLARAAIRELLTDEIDHARLGWAFLQSLDPAMRARISAWLAPLCVTNLREWRKLESMSGRQARSGLFRATQLHAAELARHGVPTFESIRTALAEAIEGVLLPGFGHAKLDTRGVEAWVKQGMPT